MGGTHQYIEALMWTNSLLKEYLDTEPLNHLPADLPESGEEMEVDYATLKKIDPLMAEKIHPNDIRKIKRSLDV